MGRTKEEKYEDFLSKLNVGFLTRKAAMASTPTMDITENGGKWKMVTSTTLKSIVLEFELGVEFDEKTADGRECKTTVTKDGDTMITMQKAQKKDKKKKKEKKKFSALSPLL